MDDRIDLLEKKRVELGLTHNQFADLLHVDRGQWSKVRRGKQGLGSQIPLAAAREFPELRGVFLAIGHNQVD